MANSIFVIEISISRESLLDRGKPKDFLLSHLDTAAINDRGSRPLGQRVPNHTLLVYPDDRRFFELRVLLLEFAGSGAERNAFRLREVRRRPFSMSGGVTCGGEDILFLRHGRIRCMCRMIRKLVDLRFTADIGHTTILGKCRACEK